MVAAKNQAAFDELDAALKDNPPGVTAADRFRLLEKAVGLRPTPKDRVKFPASIHNLLHRMKAQRATELAKKLKALSGKPVRKTGCRRSK